LKKIKNISNIRKKLFDPLAWHLSRREIRILMQTGNEIPNVIRQMRDYQGRGWYASIHPRQHNSELANLLNEIILLEPKVILEIGTDRGGSLYGFCRVSRNPELIISIDLPGGEFGGGYLPCRKKLYKEFIYDKQFTKMHLMQCDSHQPSTHAELLKLLNGKFIDFIFFDGDHTYEGIKIDFELYYHLVRPGGIIAFHDIITGDKNHEVFRFWGEIRERYAHKEFIENPQGQMGIGILCV
jgi:cephalosporin hydroxylase